MIAKPCTNPMLDWKMKKNNKARVATTTKNVIEHASAPRPSEKEVSEKNILSTV